jgi:peptidoglycan/LPS O-acetylase OafA/YrhL
LAVSVLDEQVLTGWGYTILAFGWAIVLLWAVSARGWVTFTPLRLLGRLSYSAYLWHYPITFTLRGGDIHHTSKGTTLAAIVLTFAASWVSYRWIETPFRNLTRTRSGAIPSDGGLRR